MKQHSGARRLIWPWPHVDAAAETIVADHVTQLDAVDVGGADTALAWSQSEPAPVLSYPDTAPTLIREADHYTQQRPWSWAIAGVTAIVLLTMVGAVEVVLHRSGPSTWLSTPTTVIESAPPTVTVTTAPDTSLPPQFATPDDLYLAIVRGSGLYVYDAPPMITLGHKECAILSQTGETKQDALAALRQEFTGLTARESEGIVDGAIEAYCPQFKGKST